MVICLSLLVLAAHLSFTSAKIDCKEGCTKYGTCNEELGRCDCPWNMTGDACNEHNPAGFCLRRSDGAGFVNTCTDGDPSLCLNACNKRGQCKGGFCHCSPGFFGTDCSLSYGKGSSIQILQGQGYKETQRGPLIYVYEIPPEFHVKRDIHKIDRPPLHLAMYERILSGGHRTSDGSKADFFFLPITSRDLKKAFLLHPILDYIAVTWPFWNQTGGQGARHVIPMEGDVGTCELPLKVRTCLLTPDR
jgi:hypothetical protein